MRALSATMSFITTIFPFDRSPFNNGGAGAQCVPAFFMGWLFYDWDNSPRLFASSGDTQRHKRNC